ncbi:MAG: Hint domain-containing protein [Candidatus Limnocylindrales bacterium]
MTPGSSPGSTPVASVSPLLRPDLRYRLVDSLGRPLFCDPDFYPVARFDEADQARRYFAAIRGDAPAYAAIIAHLGIAPAATPTDTQTLAIYRAWKMLRALTLNETAGRFGFDYIAADGTSETSGWHVVGAIDTGGSIGLDRRDPSGPPPCPICLARGTSIATPAGLRLVEDLRPGMPVWTSDVGGRRVMGFVIEVGSTPVPSTHEVVQLILSDGRRVNVSPGHPLPDGRRLGDLRPGDLVDGSIVVSANLEPYDGGATFDLLPSGPTGTYWANGIRLASTLATRR